MPQAPADGRYIAFSSGTGDLDPGVSPRGDGSVYIYDRISDSHQRAGFNRHAQQQLALSADGGFLAFVSSDDLISDNFFLNSQIYLYDRVAKSLTFVSRDSGLVAEDANLRRDVYLFNFDPVAPGGPVTVPPCLLFDTRRPADGPAMRSNAARVVKATGICGVPATAKRVTVNVTAFQETGKGNLRFYPGDLAAPSTGILRFSARQTRSGAFDLPVAGNGTGVLTILPFVAGQGTTGASVEVTGYTP